MTRTHRAPDPGTTDLRVGDSIIVVGTPLDGELGTVIEVLLPVPGVADYRVVLETGRELRLPAGNLARRQ